MRRILTVVGVLVGGAVVGLGLYQAFGSVDAGTIRTLVGVYPWSMVAVIGLYIMGYTAMKHAFSPTSTADRPTPSSNQSGMSSHPSKSAEGRNRVEY